MHNNFYEQIFQKLQNVELPPDPNGWLEMEKLLEKEKPKRKPLGWLWIAALIGVTALSGGGFWYFNNFGSTSGAQTQIILSENNTEQSSELKTVEPRLSEKDFVFEEINGNKKSSSNYNEIHLSNGVSKPAEQYAYYPVSEKISIKSKNGSRRESKNNNPNITKAVKSKGMGIQKIASTKVSNQNAILNNLNTEFTLQNTESVFSNSLVENTTESENSISENNEAVSMAVLSQAPEVPVVQESKQTQPNTTDQKESFKSIRKVSFGIGFYSNLQAAILGSNVDKRPSHQSGLAFSLYFKKIAALHIGLGIGMTQLSQKKLSGPKANNTIVGFNTQIQEVSIPLALTLFPFKSDKVNFGITLGIGNHIKMRENIRLIYSEEKESTTSLLDNNFSDNQQQVLVASKNGDFKLEDMALGGTGRYYISGFAALRTEIKVFKNLWFNVELNSSIKPKPGTQANPLMGVGGGLGLGYRF